MIFRVHMKNSKMGWYEEFTRDDITGHKEASIFAKRLVENFNTTLKGDKEEEAFTRELVGISIPDNEHDWGQTNHTELKNRRGRYNTYRCCRCMIKGKMYITDKKIIRDQEYKAKRYAVCFQSTKITVHNILGEE